jgi:hypothetical protein
MTRALLIATALVAATPAAFAGDKEHHPLGPGCAPDRPAIAHRAGGVAVESPRGKAHAPPIPCSTPTDFRTPEISIVITNEGTILFQPVYPQSGLPIGVLRSVDQGATWEFIDPKTNPPRTSSVDMTMWVDRRSGRVFWSNDLELPPGRIGPPARVDLSDDDGRTWFSSSTLVGFHYISTQIVSGPSVKNFDELIPGSPDPVYICTAGSISCPVFNFCGKHCSKSSDLGETFGPASPVPFPPECPFPGIHPTGAFGLNGVVGRDGTVYEPLTPCERPYIAISHDEGTTWQLALVADTETIGWGELGIGLDDAGNLYAAWTDARDRLPYLAISLDRGQHWNQPLMIAAPGVNEAAIPQLVAGERGQVAVAYYGSRNAPRPLPPDCFIGSATIPNLSGKRRRVLILPGSSVDQLPGLRKADLEYLHYRNLERAGQAAVVLERDAQCAGQTDVVGRHPIVEARSPGVRRWPLFRRGRGGLLRVDDDTGRHTLGRVRPGVSFRPSCQRESQLPEHADRCCDRLEIRLRGASRPRRQGVASPARSGVRQDVATASRHPREPPGRDSGGAPEHVREVALAGESA